MPRNTPKAADDEMRAIKLEIERAKLAKLEADLPRKAAAEYTRYEDLPPLSLEDRDRLKQELIDLLTVSEEEAWRKKYEWYMSMAHWAP